MRLKAKFVLLFSILFLTFLIFSKCSAEELPVPEDSIVHVNEIVANPVGNDSDAEWIELYNGSDEAVDLQGWSLVDTLGSTHQYYFNDSALIEAHGFLVVNSKTSGITLNNDQDSIRLLKPDDTVASESEIYTNAREGVSWSRKDDGSWAWTTTLTPSASNIFDPETPIVVIEKDEPILLTIAEARTRQDGESVWIKGKVTVFPGTLGAQYFYIEDETAGMQIYSYSKEFPLLEIGQTVEIKGVLSGANSDRRVKISQLSDIVIVTVPIVSIEPKPLEIIEVNEKVEGQYVTVSGEVSRPSGDTFYVKNDQAEVKIVVKSGANIDKPRLKTGQSITVSGVVSQYQDEYRILPTRQEDVRVVSLGQAELPKTGPDDSILFSIIISAPIWTLYLIVSKRQKILLRA
ncbi:MAG: lamin tail domain-containing protein [Candidatus Berkelbacteria bacterium]